VDVRIESRVEGPTTVVTVAGQLSGGGVRELRELCRSIEGGLALDLSDLGSADAEGLEALRAMENRGVELRGTSPFIRRLLANDLAGDRESGEQ
jgi:hypothetical protein